MLLLPIAYRHTAAWHKAGCRAPFHRQMNDGFEGDGTDYRPIPSLRAFSRHPAGRQRCIASVSPAKEALLYSRILRLSRENRRLRRLAITDDLTGAFNRRHYSAKFEQLLATPRQGESPALCLFDIDHFKSINDCHGHAFGDRVLCEISRHVRQKLRRSGDRLFRIGGDEFAILYSAASLEKALHFARELHRCMSRVHLSCSCGARYTASASFGVAWLGFQDITKASRHQMYEAADAALYQAKNAGRNQVKGIELPRYSAP